MTGFVNGNSTGFAGITNNFSYNKRLQPLFMSAASPTQTVLSIGYDFHLGNGDNGNVYVLTNNKDNTRNQTFTYDQLNRLTSAQNAGTNCQAQVLHGNLEYWGNTYTYDAWGNLTNKSKISSACAGENLQGTADVQNRIHPVSGPDYSYDAAGNMTKDNLGQSYTYDPENHITGAAGYAYAYDADGNRVEKATTATPPTGTLYWYMTPGVVAESDLNGNLQSEYIFFNGERVARKDFPSNAVSYYFSDHLRTTDIVTDAQGNILNESDFYPWGGELQFSANDSNHYKFTGKERDAETGLDYFGARYYSQALGRFITADWSATPVPVPYADLTDPQTLNQYSYVRNIPTVKVDADGHWPQIGSVLWQAAQEIVDNPGQAWRDVKQSTVSFVQSVVNLLPVGDNKPSPGYVPLTQQDPPATSAVGRLTTGGLVGATAAIPGPKGAGAVEEEAGIAANAAKGAASESRVLNDLGQTKNTQAVVGTEGKSIPDFQTKTTVGEIKDAQAVSNTKQLRIQKEAAQNSGRQHELHTGTNTHVTKPAAQGTKVVRRDDLGPK